MINEARARISMTDSEVVARFARFGYRVSIDDIAFTTEQIDDFREARLTWIRAGHLVIDEQGLLVIEQAQPRHGQPTRDMVIVSLGHSRAVMGHPYQARSPSADVRRPPEPLRAQHVMGLGEACSSCKAGESAGPLVVLVGNRRLPRHRVWLCPIARQSDVKS